MNELMDHYTSYMVACYGDDWKDRVPQEQIREIKQAFFSGVLICSSINQQQSMDIANTISMILFPEENN